MPASPQTTATPATHGGHDYGYVRRTLEFITRNWRDQPSLAVIAGHVGVSPDHLQRVFTRWAGLSPKGFLQAVTLDHARKLLRESASLLETAHDVGLSGPGRLHDLFVTHEGMSPGAYKAQGAGLTFDYGFHDSPFGQAVLMMHGPTLAGLAFADDGAGHEALEDLMNRWPHAAYRRNDAASSALAMRIFDPRNWCGDRPVRVTFIGTDFEIRVWRTLLRIPLGRVTTYGAIAKHLGKPGAARAVGAAAGRNPISFVVPCHRVVGASGKLCGYHWGLTRKRAMLGWEAGISAQVQG